MPRFHETMGGRKFYEHDVPAFLNALRTIGSALQESNEIAVRHNQILIEANELKKRELDVK